MLITNIDREHLDIYKDLSDLKATFLKLVSRVTPGGLLVLNRDNENLYSLRSKIIKLARSNKLQVVWYSGKDRIAPKVKKVLKIPGRHNISNAVGAYHLIQNLGVDEKIILGTFAKYAGSWRRYEFKGQYKSGGTTLKVFDDYAHHPTEIKATLQAFREKFPRAKLVCVFQPHQHERLKRLFKEFQTAFKDADAVLFFPEYAVMGREEKPSPFTSKALAWAVKKKYPKQFVEYVPNAKRFSRKDIAAALRGKARNEAVVIMMGAGNIVNHTKQLLD